MWLFDRDDKAERLLTVLSFGKKLRRLFLHDCCHVAIPTADHLLKCDALRKSVPHVELFFRKR
jgi:hypothetical protein